MEQLVFVCVWILAALSSALDHSLITESVPSVSGVLLLTGPKAQYQFDFSEASEACLFKNLSIATRSQLQTALDHGLEACRFGWISEQVAAVPRLSSVSTCGSGKTGVVTWSAPLQRRFGVWCFSQSDSNEAESTTTAFHTSTLYLTTSIPQRLSTFTTAATLAITAVTTTTTTIPKTSQATRNPTTKPLTTTRTTLKAPTSAPWIQTTKRKTAHSESVSTQFTTATSSKSFSFVFIHSLSTAGSTSTVRNYSSKPNLSSVSVKHPRQRALSTALIAFCIIGLVLSAGGAIVYYKVSERWVWHHMPQKDDIETETFKQTCSEVELQEETEGETEGEGEGRRFSSETMLYVNHDARTD